MNRGFEWQADDELTFEQQGPLAPPPRQLVNRRWLALLVFVLLAVGGGFTLFIHRQAKGLQRQAESEVKATHALVWQAALSADTDILDTLLTQGDAQWRRAQLSMARAGVLANRTTLGLRVADPDAPVAVASVQLNDDLTLAAVTYTVDYQVSWYPAPLSPVPLERQAFYGRDGQSWLLRPPPDEKDYWGPWATVGQAPLTIIVPKRDADLGQRLAPELGAVLANICNAPDTDCPSAFHLQLKLDRDPASLALINDSADRLGMTRYQETHYMQMPAPSLIGRPVGATGYEALLRGYSNWLGAVLLQRFGVGDLDNPGIEGLERRLAALGLSLPPPPERPLRPPQATQALPVQPWPEEDLVLLCRDFNKALILRYRLSANNWAPLVDAGASPISREALGADTATAMIAAPDGRGVLLFTLRRSEAGLSTRILLLTEEGERLLLEVPYELHPLPTGYRDHSDPSRERLVVYELQSQGDELQMVPAYLDYRACLDGLCRLIPSSGFPFWSPEGDRRLLLEVWDGPPRLVLAGAPGEETWQLGRGVAPRWLDEQTLSYVAVQILPREDWPSAISAVAVARTEASGAVTETLVSAGELWANLPDETREQPLLIEDALRHPGQATSWLVAATDYSSAVDGGAYLFTFDEETGQGSLIHSLPQHRLMEPMTLQANGAYLSLATLSLAPPAASGSLTVFDLGAGERTQPAQYDLATNTGAYDWSADGQWLAVAKPGEFRLIAPKEGYERVVTHELSDCGTLAWIFPSEQE